MAIENVDAFYKHALKNPALLHGLGAATDPASLGQKVAEIGKAAGFDFNGDEARSWIGEKLARQANGELDDEELEAVAGGKAGVPPQLTNLVMGMIKDGVHLVQNAADSMQAAAIARSNSGHSL